MNELPGILERRRADAAEMGQLAREAWERWMQPGVILFGYWLRAIEEIVETRPAGWSEAEQHRRWRSNRFRWENGIHPIQGVAHRIEKRLP